ncbi:MAG: hypothetical protein JNL18_22515 [Planctomycetaceae bacterium]|nr:hypothetical protein [Planctomycetaceae bacterium]
MTNWNLLLRGNYFAAIVCSAFWCLQAAPAYSAQLSFPGAEGAGRFTVGGRGGDVYHVTNLNDSGPGSLREGVQSASGPRTILFQVSGTIRLIADLVIETSKLTIAGQSAPGDGITIADRSVVVNNSRDVVLQFLRFRPGDTYVVSDENYEPDSLWVRNSRNVMIDHVSASWGVDEILSVTHNSRNVTVQWSMITEALHNSGHNKGDHGYGSLINGGDITFHHNLYAHNRSRNPRPGEQVRLDFVNNVIYNPGGKYGYSGADDAISLNYVGNYGIDTSATSAMALFEPDSAASRVFVSGNYRDSNRNRSLDGVDVGAAALAGAFTRAFSRFDLPAVETTHAKQAYIDVLTHAGASVRRDGVDHRVIGTVLNQNGARIDSQHQVGGWSTLAAGTLPLDSNNDGIPDRWAISQKLDPGINYAQQFAPNGYTYLENYLHSLSKDLYPLRNVKTFDVSTSYGRGADAQVGENRVNGRVVSLGWGRDLALQATYNSGDNARNEYVLLKFDLQRLLPGSLTGAQLELTLLQDFGGVQRFAIYGLESGVDSWDWNETTVDFADAPALAFDGNSATRGLIPSELLRLGVLTVQNVAAGDIVSFDNPNLSVFLNRLATYAPASNQTVSILLQPLVATADVVQFASRESENGLLAPRLVLSGRQMQPVPEPRQALLVIAALLAMTRGYVDRLKRIAASRLSQQD